MTKAWHGDWYGRIEQRVQSLGFESTTAFVAAQPTISLLDLADQLGKDDVAAKQLRKVLLDEARAAGTLQRCARDLLVRELHRRLPEGWYQEWDEDTKYCRASAFGDWRAVMGEANDNVTERICYGLEAANIPRGWLPADPDDPILLEIFEHHWRESQ